MCQIPWNPRRVTSMRCSLAGLAVGVGLASLSNFAVERQTPL